MAIDKTRKWDSLTKCESLWPIVVLEMMFIAWVYYVMVVLVCLDTFMSAECVIVLVFYHPLFMMTLLSYVRTLTAPIPPIPPEFHVPVEEFRRIQFDSLAQQRMMKKLGIKTVGQAFKRDSTFALSYCFTCEVVKPDRCHHCSRCKKCILRMDHHCPWINRCVGFHNHKYFVLFLHYTFVHCFFVILLCSGVLHRVYIRDRTQSEYYDDPFTPPTGASPPPMNSTQSFALSSFPEETANNNTSSNTSMIVTPAITMVPSVATRLNITTDIKRGGGPALINDTGISPAFLQITSVLILNLILIIALIPLLHMHIALLAENSTTLEWSRPVAVPGDWYTSSTFDCGSVRANHRQVLGDRVCLWLLPIFTTPGDGAHFTVKGELSADELRRLENDKSTICCV